MELVTNDSGRNVSCDASHDTEATMSNNIEDSHEEDTVTKEGNEGIRSYTKQRREFLDNKLKNYKLDKLKRKLPVDAQILNCTQEELQIKKRMLDHMDKIDQRYSENMERMSQSMEKLSQ